MNLIYVDSNSSASVAAQSIFLAGPTSRDGTPSWRLDALAIFEELRFAGTLFIPERQDWKVKFDYIEQVEWEWHHLHEATVILFWVPRILEVWPAFTTNVEFGRYVSIAPQRCVYGRPVWGAKNRYLDWLYQKLTQRTPEVELLATIRASIALADGFRETAN